ncbi:GDNF family receptor alpha-3 [Denticeps clupeoides]|uniref:GDNF/GAS1 domain-containing protein n=1 Tax=Denticeps clupeoides TaxID=299321 RepID=A0AAY4CHK7_9TELE|nr:GDNF family receptor alpha-4-like [Denticeps clupeoides]
MTGDMIVLGIVLNIFTKGVLPSPTVEQGVAVDCTEAYQHCMKEARCRGLIQQLKECVEEESEGQLSLEFRKSCQNVQSALQRYRPLQDCRCQRSSRRELHCLRVYWSLRFPKGYNDIETSPYQEADLEMVRNMDTQKFASIVAESSIPLDGQNQCLKAAQDCGLFEKCGARRSEYVLACTKPMPGSDHCSQQKCHRALRRFMDRVPEEYSFSILFCQCTDTLCGERRRKTIVPSCSYEDRGEQPNCLHLKSDCMRDDLCRSRLADFQQHCNPSPYSGCARENGALCLRAYAGLIGTIMTPNYVRNSSVDVSLWCNCAGSGNQWHDCVRLQRLFTNNTCLHNAINTMGSFSSHTPPLPVPSPSQINQVDVFNINILPGFNSVEDSEEEEEEEEQAEEINSNPVHMIPPFSEKATVSNLNSGCGGKLQTALLVLLCPLSVSMSWG